MAGLSVSVDSTFYDVEQPTFSVIELANAHHQKAGDAGRQRNGPPTNPKCVFEMQRGSVVNGTRTSP
jgi:hypothetical protein